jgi:class 3 adenylate cyclase
MSGTVRTISSSSRSIGTPTFAHVLELRAHLSPERGHPDRSDPGERDEKRLYLPATRERDQDISVLFADLVGFTGFAERSSATAAVHALPC